MSYIVIVTLDLCTIHAQTLAMEASYRYPRPQSQASSIGHNVSVGSLDKARIPLTLYPNKAYAPPLLDGVDAGI